MESFYDWGSINLNNKEKLIQDNYSKINQISARCMRVIVAILALAFVYCYFGTDMDESVLIVFFASAIFIALIPTLIINILKFDHAPVTKHIVIICVCLIATLMLTLLSTYAYPIMLFPILLASLYYNQTLVLFASLLMSCGIVGSNYFAFRFSDVFIGFPCESFEEVMMSYVVPQIVVVFGLSVAAYFIVQRNSMMINSAINMAVTMQDNQTGLIFSFAEISESKSKFTGEHIKRVAAYMRVLAKASGFDDEYVEMVTFPFCRIPVIWLDFHWLVVFIHNNLCLSNIKINRTTFPAVLPKNCGKLQHQIKHWHERFIPFQYFLVTPL